MTTEAKGARPSHLAGLLVVASALLMGCPIDPVPLPPSGCTPGAQVTCACSGGVSGVQVCQSDRTLGACRCDVDGGGMDVAAIDARETGAPEAGTVDLGAVDLGAVDTGTPDVGDVDDGSPVDGTGSDVPPDGCVTMTPGNCCGVACPAAAHASPVCGGGVCTIACMAGYANCDGMLANGCEVTLTTSDAHCGACGNVCTMGQRCAGGSCQCPTGQTLCGGQCVDTQTDEANCSTCNAPCAAGRACIAGACVNCATGQTLCGGACVATATSSTHCGACGNACPAGSQCVAGACLACTWEAGQLCFPGRTAPNCCVAGYTCRNQSVFDDRCVSPAGTPCTTTNSCERFTRCQAGRCCYDNSHECMDDTECCSGHCRGTGILRCGD